MEQKKIDRTFAEKYLPAVYQTALSRLGDPALAKLAARRVFGKVQETMNDGTMPAETVLEAWLMFLTQDEAASMIKQMPSIAQKAEQPIKTSVAASENKTPAPIAKPAIPNAASASPLAAQPNSVQLPPQAEHTALRVATRTAAATAKEQVVPKQAATRVPRRQQTRRNTVERDTEVRFRPKKRPLRVLFIILFSVLMLINLWFIIGLLCSRDILPKVNLGYAWFDTYVLRLFNF